MPDTPTQPEKPSAGRPTKLTGEFLAAMMTVVNDAENALIYTDEELIFLVNERLPLEARICGDTFRRWKAGEIADDPRAQAFFGVYKKAMLLQKQNLFRKLDDDRNPHWQKEAWKIERKFSDWNIKHQVTVSKPEDGAAALAAVLLGGADGSPASRDTMAPAADASSGG